MLPWNFYQPRHRQQGNMPSILIFFFTAIAVVTNSFRKHMIQSLHKLYGYYHSYYAAAGKESAEKGDRDYCAVCLSNICKGEKARSMPGCKHRFHADCIGAWLKNHTTCPLCRNKVIDHVPQQAHHHKRVKSVRDSLIDLLQSFSDLLVALLYTILPPSIRESFPLVH